MNDMLEYFFADLQRHETPNETNNMFSHKQTIHLRSKIFFLPCAKTNFSELSDPFQTKITALIQYYYIYPVI